MNYDKCPTCNLNWSLNPPSKCDGSNHFRCIECKAIYAGEMLAAPSMFEGLRLLLAMPSYCATDGEVEENSRRRKIAWIAFDKAMGAT